LALAKESLVRAPDGSTVAGKSNSGACVFLERDGLCAIHRAGGQLALPVSCRMFPRSVLMDARGTSISLSHFCPTAAGLLFEQGPPAAIVEAPPSLADVGPLDGLDARRAWPPLLRAGVLMDLESYDAWERLGVELLTRERVEPQASLTALERTAERIASWTPGDEQLLYRVRNVFAVVAPPTAALAPHDMPVKRWLASRLFACWVAYQRDGLAAIVRYLAGCFDTFAAEFARDGNALEAIRRSDLRIMHTGQ
jgi:hypothetical protein